MQSLRDAAALLVLILLVLSVHVDAGDLLMTVAGGTPAVAANPAPAEPPVLRAGLIPEDALSPTGLLQVEDTNAPSVFDLQPGFLSGATRIIVVVGDEAIKHEIGTRVDFRRAAPAHRDECTMKRASLKG